MTPGRPDDGDQVPSPELPDLLADFGDDYEIATEDENGAWTARRRFPELGWRATGPVVARATTPAALRKLLADNDGLSGGCGGGSGRVRLDDVACLLAPVLHAAGLDLIPVRHHDEIIELIMRLPGDQSGNRVVLDRNGIMEWDHWCGRPGNAHGERLARVILAALGGDPDLPPPPDPPVSAHP